MYPIWAPYRAHLYPGYINAPYTFPPFYPGPYDYGNLGTTPYAAPHVSTSAVPNTLTPPTQDRAIWESPESPESPWIRAYEKHGEGE